MDIYDRINEILKDQHITKKELSNSTGISYQTLTSAFHRKSKNFKMDSIKRIAEYLNVSVDFLIRGEEFQVRERAEEYLRTHGQMDHEILKISRSLPIIAKTTLLSLAFKLEKNPHLEFQEKESK